MKFFVWQLQREMANNTVISHIRLRPSEFRYVFETQAQPLTLGREIPSFEGEFVDEKSCQTYPKASFEMR